MCGCGNNTGSSGCTIILIIVILNFLGLLDTKCNPNAKNAITLLLIWWLCGSGRFFGNNNFRGNGRSCGCNTKCCC